MKKLIDTLKFYYTKLVKVLDVALDNIVKTIEVTLSKVPQLIEDIYNIIKNNITSQNAIIFILSYILYVNFAILVKTPILLVALLIAIVMVADKLKLK